MSKVLLIEDEVQLGQIVKDSLEMRGFEMLYAEDGREGLKLYHEHHPDVVVLDIMMPNMDGFSVTTEIRKEDKLTPIIFLTAKSQTADVVKGFELGGNDYLKKPFSMEELVVRLKALMSKSRTLFENGANMDAPITIGEKYSFLYREALLKQGDTAVALTAREAELLRLFLLNKNQVMDRKSILLHIWGNDDFFSGRSLDVFITHLRKYLRHDPTVKIMNVRGIGYKLIG